MGSNDAPDVNIAVDKLVRDEVRISIVSMVGEMYLYDLMVRRSGGEICYTSNQTTLERAIMVGLTGSGRFEVL